MAGTSLTVGRTKQMAQPHGLCRGHGDHGATRKCVAASVTLRWSTNPPDEGPRLDHAGARRFKSCLSTAAAD